MELRSKISKHFRINNIVLKEQRCIVKLILITCNIGEKTLYILYRNLPVKMPMIVI